MGVYWRRGGKAYGFVLSIFIVFFYYILLSFGENLVKNEYVSSFVGIWMPNIVFAVFGIVLFRKAAREEPFFLQKKLQNKTLELCEQIKEIFEKRVKKLKEKLLSEKSSPGRPNSIEVVPKLTWGLPIS